MVHIFFYTKTHSEVPLPGNAMPSSFENFLCALTNLSNQYGGTTRAYPADDAELESRRASKQARIRQL